jgi:putative transposase
VKRARTPTVLIELPLAADSVQASHLRAHLEAGRCLYNALLSEAKRRLSKMRSDPEWQAACAIPRTRKQERSLAFSRLRQQHQFSEYALHNYAIGQRRREA